MVAPVVELSGATLPVRLKDLPDPPERVWVHGELPRGPSVAIVGTRRATEPGKRFARELAGELSEQGVAIFSGGADGIDTAAHQGALAAGGVTVVVAPASFERPFPEGNKALFERVVESGGAYFTSVPPGTAARYDQFFVRNAQLAALVDALVVIETHFIGGARNAAAAARRLSRPVFFVPGAPWMEMSVGCNLELRQGGGRFLTCANDALDVLGLPRRPRQVVLARKKKRRKGKAPGSAPESPAHQSQVDPSSDPERNRVLSELRKGPAHPDALCDEASVTAARLQALILTLTLEGIVVSEPSGLVSLVNNRIN